MKIKEMQYLYSPVQKDKSHRTDVKSMDESNSEEEPLTLSLNQNIYLCFLMLLHRGIFRKNMNKYEKFMIIIYVLFAFFIQTGGLIFFLLYDQKLGETLVEITFDNDPSPSYRTNATIYEYLAIGYQSRFGFADFVVRLLANGVIFAYLGKTIPIFSLVSVIGTHSDYWKLFIISILYELFLVFATVTKIFSLINDQTDIVDIFSVGVGFVILLKVDDY
eukprot:UN10115